MHESSWSQAEQYRNEGLEKQGYKRISVNEIAEKKFRSDFDQQKQVYMLIYAMIDESSNSNRIPSKMAFEVFPKDHKVLLGKTDDVTSKDRSQEKAEFAVSVSNDMVSLIRLPGQLYALHSRLLRNNCMGLFSWVSVKEEAPLVSVDSSTQTVLVDFGEMPNPLYAGGYFSGYPAWLSTADLNLSARFDTAKDSFLNLFCPFWLDSDSLTVEVDLHPEFLSSLPFYLGEFIRR